MVLPPENEEGGRFEWLWERVGVKGERVCSAHSLPQRLVDIRRGLQAASVVEKGRGVNDGRGFDPTSFLEGAKLGKYSLVLGQDDPDWQVPVLWLGTNTRGIEECTDDLAGSPINQTSRDVPPIGVARDRERLLAQHRVGEPFHDLQHVVARGD